MLDNPRISVIMSVYNGEKYLREAIESILSQTFTNFEFIIVNDASVDSSLEIIRSYQDERIRTINNEKNIGLTKSLNKAIREARGEYIARQDADDISLPNRFEEQIKYFDKHPEVALLGTSADKIDEQGKVLLKVIVTTKPGRSLFKGNQFNHGSTMFKRGAVDRLRGYNELFKYCQDYELWLRIANCYEVRNLKQVLYKLRFHDEAIRFKHGDESALFHLLALRSARNNLDQKVLGIINNHGIKGLYHHLSKNEKVFFHKSIANLHVQHGNLKLARKEYKKVCSLTPFDIKNNINIICSYFGRGLMIKISKIYETIRNFYVIS